MVSRFRVFTFVIAAFVATMAIPVFGQIYELANVTANTVAGSGFSGYVDGVGQQTMFNFPINVVADSSGNLFVMDYQNSRIRKITADGQVSTFAGGGTTPLPGFGTNFSLYSCRVMTIDHSDNLYLVAPNGTSLIRIEPNGYGTRIPLSNSVRDQEDGLCVDSRNNLYISYPADNRIFRYQTNGVLEVFAGSGNAGSVDGNGIFTSFNSPKALASDSADNIYVWDSKNHVIRRIGQNREVVTIAGNKSIVWGSTDLDADGVGTNASFYNVNGMCADSSGNIYLACYTPRGGSAIRKLSPTTNVTTLAGSFLEAGYANGIGSSARFDQASGVCIVKGPIGDLGITSPDTIYVADLGNQRVRAVTFNPQPTVVSGGDLDIGMYAGVKINGVVGRTYQIQTSTNATNWSTVTTLMLTSTPYLWIDPAPINTKNFYRALLLP